jgi:hypothetical protein
MAYDEMIGLLIYDLAVYRAQGEAAPVVDGMVALIDELREACEAAWFAVDSYGRSHGWVNWEDIEADLEGFSVAHPGLLFEATIAGEDGDDFRRLFVVNGRSQEVAGRIVYNEPDWEQFAATPLRNETIAI